MASTLSQGLVGIVWDDTIVVQVGQDLIPQTQGNVLAIPILSYFILFHLILSGKADSGMGSL